jgi:hypothetical protein
MDNLAKRLFATSNLAAALFSALSMTASAQPVPVPCYSFRQDALGTWIATEPVTMDTLSGTIDVMPGHRVGIPVANILNERCQ